MEQPDAFFQNVAFSWLKENPDCIVPVRHQGPCCACYAFTTCDCISAAYYLKYGDKVVLAPQQFVDCLHRIYKSDKCPTADFVGCIPSSLRKSFRMAKDVGVYLEADYPYIAAMGPICYEPTFAERKISIEGFVHYRNAQSVPETHILDFLMKQPIAGVVFLYTSFTLHREGIYNSPTLEDLAQPVLDVNGDPASLHAVLIVGFGEENGEQYYLLKNSWGENWGHRGYAKIRRHLLKSFAKLDGPHPRYIVKPVEDYEYIDEYTDKKPKDKKKKQDKGSKETQKKSSGRKDKKSSGSQRLK